MTLAVYSGHEASKQTSKQALILWFSFLSEPSTSSSNFAEATGAEGGKSSAYFSSPEPKAHR